MSEPLCPPFFEAIEMIKAKASQVVEIGSGDGAWLRALWTAGVEAVGFDINPRGPGVAYGDHTDAAKYDRPMLAVWPPDGDEIQKWIAARRWPVVFLCAAFGRINPGATLSPYSEEHERVQFIGGRKGTSEFRVYS